MAVKKKAGPHTLTAQTAVNTDRLDRIEPVLVRIVERLDSIEDSLQRNKGFWGAITLIGGAIATFLTMFKDSFLQALQR